MDYSVAAVLDAEPTRFRMLYTGNLCRNMLIDLEEDGSVYAQLSRTPRDAVVLKNTTAFLPVAFYNNATAVSTHRIIIKRVLSCKRSKIRVDNILLLLLNKSLARIVHYTQHYTNKFFLM